MDDDGILNEAQALAHLDSLLEDVSPSGAHEVLAQALWRMPPWSSFTPYIRLMFRVAGDRYGEGLDRSSRAMALAAHGRASMADRRYQHAIGECEAAMDSAAAGGGPALQRACRSLYLRAKLQAGRTTEALEGLARGENAFCSGDPMILGLDVLLSTGIAQLVRGDGPAALEAFSAVERATEACEEQDITCWLRTRALAGRGHALFRELRPAEAMGPLDDALALARANRAPRETADLLVMRSVCALASSADKALEGLEETASLVSGLRPTNGAVDLFTGVPADLGGAVSLREAAGDLYESARERAVSMDTPGFLVAILGLSGLLAVDGSQEEAIKMLHAAREALSSSKSPEFLSLLDAAEAVLTH